MNVRKQGEEDEAQALTGVYLEARHVKFAHVELHPDDGEHDDGEEEQEANLKQRDHGLHDGLQHHLETWRRAEERMGWDDVSFCDCPRLHCKIVPVNLTKQ